MSMRFHRRVAIITLLFIGLSLAFPFSLPMQMISSWILHQFDIFYSYL
ncbi:hypothetical protein JOD24_003170 [Kroppenstedtia sanguinis]